MEVNDEEEDKLIEFFDFIIKSRRLMNKGAIPNTTYRAIVEMFFEMLKEDWVGG